MKALLFASVAFLVAGCKVSTDDIVIDECLRIQLAQQCVANLPAGPTETKYNDWAEVVNQCDTNAMWQAKRQRQYVKPECAR